MSGWIFDIQRFSVHDGPGIRSTVYMKGCSLRCPWCHNPEGIESKNELRWVSDKCVSCGECVTACSSPALTHSGETLHYDASHCTACGQCVYVCGPKAWEWVAREYEIDEVLAKLRVDKPFYTESGGGITLSGGEPFLQAEFCERILSRCQKEGIHTAIETALHVPWEAIQKTLPFLDLIMIDIKIINEELHRKTIGVDNRRILENANRLSREGIPLVVRTPVIPSFNDNLEAILDIVRFIAEFPTLQYFELLPYHSLGAGKAKHLLPSRTGRIFPELDIEKLAKIYRVVCDEGISVKCDIENTTVEAIKKGKDITCLSPG